MNKCGYVIKKCIFLKNIFKTVKFKYYEKLTNGVERYNLLKNTLNRNQKFL